jgi:5,10-methylenetetrahydromethanopterin reductase
MASNERTGAISGIAIQLTDVVARRIVGGQEYRASVRDAAELVSLGERLDGHFDRLWITDNLGFRNTTVLLSALASRTSLSLGTFTSYPYGRSPIDVASSLVTIKELLGERDLAFGISRGSRAVTQLHHGDRPGRLLGEFVPVLRRLLAGERVAVGDYPELVRTHAFAPDATLQLQIEPAEVPVLVASTGHRTLRMAGERSDGVIFVTQQPTQSAGLLAQPQFADASGLAGVEEGRNASDIDAFRRVYGISVSVADDPDEATGFARRQAAGLLATKTGEQLERVGIDPEVGRSVREAMDAGGLEDASGRVPLDVVRQLIMTGEPGAVAEQVADAVARTSAWEFDEHFICFPLGPDLRQAVDIVTADILPRLR